MKVVFMGTPDFAKTVLEAVFEAGHEIMAVYTQPDRPKGRSGEPVFSPVKEYALEHGFTVYQPERIKRSEAVEELKKIEADVYVVAAYGQILSEEILNIPRYGAFNAHGSLLPMYRGSSPIQRAIADGQSVTGVSVQKMDKGMDTGDIVLKEEVPILYTDDETSMYEKLAILAGKLMVETLVSLENQTITYTPQDDSQATLAPMLTKQEGKVSFAESAHIIDCKVRGFRTWPTMYTFFHQKLLKILNADGHLEGIVAPDGLTPGTLYVTKKNVYVMTGDGLLELKTVQPEGKKAMPAIDFARGAHLETGMRLDD